MSYQVIARKYRPQSFAEVVGQEHVTRTLANAIRAGRVAHAYIFSGARGVGKTTTARILAKALNCAEGPTPEPCNACDACREIAAGTSFDVMEIDAASNRGIDEIRELREMVRYAPLSRRRRIVILDEAHMLTTEAANALLKTLEEPPPGVVFVMATTEPEKLPETIRSRSQHFHFRALTFQEISDAIAALATREGLELEPGALAVIARAAEGSLRDGLSVLEQAIAFCGNRISDAQVRMLLGVVAEEALDELVEAIRENSAERALGLVHRLIAEGQNLQHFCREAIRHFRNLLVARVCGADSDLIAAPVDERPRLARQAAAFSEEDLTRYFQLLLHVEDDLRRKPDPRLHLEIGLLRMVNAARLAPLEELLASLRGETRTTAAPAGRPAAGAAAPALAMSNPAGGAPASAPKAAPGDSARKKLDTRATPEEPESEAAEGNSGTQSAALPMTPRSAVAQSAAELSGLTLAQQEAIKAAIAQQHRMLFSLLEPVRRWELESGELRLYYPSENRPLADILQTREPLEKLRAISSQVLGQPLRVCVRLESAAPAAPSGAALGLSAELRRKAEQDPVVREMLARFGGRVVKVDRRENEG
jgi:DNA polymerase-3 subunit gamma/tau